MGGWRYRLNLHSVPSESELFGENSSSQNWPYFIIIIIIIIIVIIIIIILFLIYGSVGSSFLCEGFL